MSQTTIQKTPAIRKGSVRVLVGDDFSSLVDIGALRDPVFNSLVENQAIQFDNVDDLKKFVNGTKVQVSFNLAEINLTNLAKLDAGLMTVTTVAGTLVSGAEQVVASGSWNYNVFIPFTNQNGAGTVPTINSVTLGTDGAIVAETDYVTAKQGNTWGIIIWDSTTVTTEAQSVTIDTDYTPSASKKITMTDSGTKTLVALRLINTDENGLTFKIDIENGTNFTPISIDFAGDDEEDVAILPVQFEGSLVEIVDEQQTT